MQNFAPLPALAGGTLIGLACAMMWLGNGRIAGISGIFGNLLPARKALWRIVFLGSMVVGALAASWAIPGLGVGGPAGAPAHLISAPAGFAWGDVGWLSIAGLLIGVGTKLANGCTSGHGVCGLARLSPRSAVAVGVFFVVAIITVVVTRVVP